MGGIWPEIGIERLLDLSYLTAALVAAQAWLHQQLLVPSTLVQAIVVGLAFLAARLAAPRLRAWIERQARRHGLEERLTAGARALAPLALPVCWLTFQWLSVSVAAALQWPHALVRTTVSLLTAWVGIRLTSSLVRDPVWAKAVALTVWTIAALNIIELLQPTIVLLDQLGLTLGGMRISALTVIKAMLALALLLWLATFASRLLESRIKSAPNLTPSVQVLFTKLLKIVLVTIA
ncbi:MAG: mechanosensitive ion channel protein MscS, partial [Geminicoccaceae bacterium]|nr:mechanosensitive ion channel protein MscS [Geminicoccaceae bacterium]